MKAEVVARYTGTIVAVCLGSVALLGCAGESSDAATGPDVPIGAPLVSGAEQGASATTAPLLVDPSVDLDAIDRPLVLWFWAPG